MIKEDRVMEKINKMMNHYKYDEAVSVKRKDATLWHKRRLFSFHHSERGTSAGNYLNHCNFSVKQQEWHVLSRITVLCYTLNTCISLLLCLLDSLYLKVVQMLAEQFAYKATIRNQRYTNK